MKYRIVQKVVSQEEYNQISVVNDLAWKCIVKVARRLIQMIYPKPIFHESLVKEGDVPSFKVHESQK